MGHWKVAQCLLAGDTVVLRPSPFTPLTLLRISEYIRELLPPGVFNVVIGGHDLWPWMTSHSGKAIRFTNKEKRRWGKAHSGGSGSKRSTSASTDSSLGTFARDPQFRVLAAFSMLASSDISISKNWTSPGSLPAAFSPAAAFRAVKKTRRPFARSSRTIS